MAARQLLSLQLFEGENGDAFLEKLMASPMISITYEDNKVSANLRLPETLVCEVSSGMRHLCDQNHKRTFAIEEVLGESQRKFEVRLCLQVQRSDFTGILACFTKWLYSGLVESKLMYHHDHWYFGQRIGAPRFQNAVFQALRLKYYSLPIEDTLVNGVRKSEIDAIWNIAEAVQDQLGDEIEEADLNIQKMLMFVLDYMVYLGPDHLDVREMLLEGGPLTLKLAKRMAVTPRAGEVQHPPWHPVNFDKYLLDETATPRS